MSETIACAIADWFKANYDGAYLHVKVEEGERINIEVDGSFNASDLADFIVEKLLPTLR